MIIKKDLFRYVDNDCHRPLMQFSKISLTGVGIMLI